MTSTQFIDWALDNQALSEEEFIAALRKQLAIEVPYNHDAPKTIDACGITHPELVAGDIIFKDHSKFSMQVEDIENKYSSRELAFIAISYRKMLYEMKLSVSELVLNMICKDMKGGK